MSGDAVRVAARLLIFDEQSRLLLLAGVDPNNREKSFWFAPGGGVEASETLQQAAVREAHEETGAVLDPADVRGPVYEEHVEYEFAGALMRQKNHFFVIRVPGFTPHQRNVSAQEQEYLTAARWWEVQELHETTQQLYPVPLVQLIPAALRLLA